MQTFTLANRRLSACAFSVQFEVRLGLNQLDIVWFWAKQFRIGYIIENSWSNVKGIFEGY
jgi:hypothetical protein